MILLRRLYDWVLHWAHTPYGVPALFLLAFAESSFFPLPPDILLLALCLSLPARSYRFAFITTVGSVVGGMVGYFIGSTLWGATSDLFYQYVPGFTPTGFSHIQQLFSSYDFWVIFTAGFTPVPYKIFTIGAGVFEINFPLFVVTSVISRGLRFFILAWLIHTFGDKVKAAIDKYFNLLTLIFMVLLLGGFLLFTGLR
ncbi:cytochrome B [Syntrophotalea acetylenivorans]|uniref:Cytochrome B n=1 Tax=Syntrophotalea acetylenivorans TaxID=1842532 RepID=A0A1L3GMB3_9BACT|nr:VTT domain-containing protein [Syntrophotalea acetylenivorans]APG26818.1 cytochrome B [Syntrophotalea acetylenivorans]